MESDLPVCYQLARLSGQQYCWRRLCKYNLSKGDFFVLRWARVRQVIRGSISSEMLICGGMCSILVLPLVAGCVDTIGVCIWRMFYVCCCHAFYIYLEGIGCSDCVGFCGNVCCVAGVVEDSYF